jgi:hypothetical protein
MRVPGIIGASGQSFRALMAFALMIGGAVFAWAAPHFWPHANATFPFDLIGTLAIAFGLAFGCWGIRCPNCKSKWVLWAMRTQPFQSWLDAVLFTQTCPTCKKDYRADDAAAQQSHAASREG